MTALLIILGIIAFFIVLLSVKVVVTVHYEDEVEVSLGWLFLKFNILPSKEKEEKKKKDKKPKEEKPKEESEIIKEPKKKKQDNMFVRFYRNRGVEGVVQLLKDAAKAVGGMFRRIGRAFLFEELFVSLTVGKGDSAQTAIKYGETCAAAFPAMGLIVNTMRVKKYSIEINPDFIYGKSNAKLHTKVSVRPLKLINAVIIVAFELLFKVVIKLLKHGRAKKPVVEKQVINNTNSK
ncbi:MAG: DUF2953 domain-containing protein [Clostridia bacterium]|nr:DUF2953 domain-containing protein [Clostridia bacterium]